MQYINADRHQLRVRYTVKRDMNDSSISFRPVSFGGGTGVDFRGDCVVYGEISRYNRGMSRYTPEALAAFDPAVKAVINLIAQGVPTRHFNQDDDWGIQLNDTSITVRFADLYALQKYKEAVGEWIDALFGYLQESAFVAA